MTEEMENKHKIEAYSTESVNNIEGYTLECKILFWCKKEEVRKLEAKYKELESIAVSALNGVYYDDYPRDAITRALRDIKAIKEKK